MIFLLLLVVLLAPSVTQAAYQSPIVVTNESQDGRTKLVFQFTGNAGEPVVRKEFIVQPTTTATLLRNWIDATITELDLMRTAATLPSVQAGQTVTRLAPAPPAPTAKTVWRRKVEAYKNFAGNSFTGGIATDLATLKADIEATYQAGFLQGE